MARYIDADKLIDELRADLARITADTFTRGVVKATITLLQEFPTADVVEVVRCKDCKYGEIDDTDFPDQYLCHHNGSDWNKGNHFCSYGERKQDNG